MSSAYYLAACPFNPLMMSSDVQKFSIFFQSNWSHFFHAFCNQFDMSFPLSSLFRSYPVLLEAQLLYFSHVVV